MEVLAQGGEIRSTSEILAFDPHLDLLLVVGIIAVGYFWGIPRLASRHAPPGEPAVTTLQKVLFGLGLLLWLAVSGYPIHDIGYRSLFTFHMIEHMTLAWVVPPLLLLGSPWWFTRLLVKPILPVLRLLTKPLEALLLFNAILAGIHVPAVVELMVTNDLFHFFAHFALMASAFILWFPILGPIPDLPKLAPMPAFGYLFANSLVPTIAASFLTFAREPIYGIYEEFPRLWGLSVVDDQVIPGLIMKLGGGLILWSVIVVIFFRWWSDEQKYAPSFPERISAS